MQHRRSGLEDNTQQVRPRAWAVLCAAWRCEDGIAAAYAQHAVRCCCCCIPDALHAASDEDGRALPVVVVAAVVKVDTVVCAKSIPLNVDSVKGNVMNRRPFHLGESRFEREPMECTGRGSEQAMERRIRR